MNAELKAKWLAALRSEKYRQTQGCLRHADAFCCLGVLADVKGCEWRSQCPIVGGENMANYGLLDVNFIQIGKVEQQQLAKMNDGGASFPEIADYIEANIPAEDGA